LGLKDPNGLALPRFFSQGILHGFVARFSKVSRTKMTRWDEHHDEIYALEQTALYDSRSLFIYHLSGEHFVFLACLLSPDMGSWGHEISLPAGLKTI
jgi:hypothetical protein